MNDWGTTNAEDPDSREGMGTLCLVCLSVVMVVLLSLILLIGFIKR
jgi:hypothetical protein